MGRDLGVHPDPLPGAVHLDLELRPVPPEDRGLEAVVGEELEEARFPRIDGLSELLEDLPHPGSDLELHPPRIPRDQAPREQGAERRVERLRVHLQVPGHLGAGAGAPLQDADDCGVLHDVEEGEVPEGLLPDLARYAEGGELPDAAGPEEAGLLQDLDVPAEALEGDVDGPRELPQMDSGPVQDREEHLPSALVQEHGDPGGARRDVRQNGLADRAAERAPDSRLSRHPPRIWGAVKSVARSVIAGENRLERRLRAQPVAGGEGDDRALPVLEVRAPERPLLKLPEVPPQPPEAPLP